MDIADTWPPAAFIPNNKYGSLKLSTFVALHQQVIAKRLPEQAGGVILRIRLRFHNYAQEERARWLAFHQQAADELGATTSAGRAKKG